MSGLAHRRGHRVMMGPLFKGLSKCLRHYCRALDQDAQDLSQNAADRAGLM